MNSEYIKSDFKKFSILHFYNFNRFDIYSLHHDTISLHNEYKYNKIIEIPFEPFPHKLNNINKPFENRTEHRIQQKNAYHLIACDLSITHNNYLS